jgi:Kef-type K+ transport system membrane component KefB
MKVVKQASIYLITLAIAGAGILIVLRFGSSLPIPRATTIDAAVHAAAVSQQPSALAGLLANLNSPLAHLFIQLLLIIAASRLLVKAGKHLGLPAVIGEMGAGILLGPSLFGMLAPGAFAFVFPADSLGALKLLSQVGVCFFMFVVGMELNVGHLRNKARTAVAVSHAGILVPFLFGVMLAYLLFNDLAGPRATFNAFALFMGISMSITAFPVLARILQERGMSGTVLGSTAITCAAIGDVTAWSILAFVGCIATSSSLNGAVLTLLLAVLFVAVMGLGVRRVLPVWFGREALRQEEPSNGTLAIVVCLIIAAAMSTEAIGIHALFGAFLAGAIMPDISGFREKINARLQKFSAVVLLPLFFAFTGLRTQINLLDDIEGWLLCGLIIAVATLGKLGASAVAGRITGMSWRESLQLGALMNARGLMELIALNIGYDLKILSPRIFTMLVIMALVTTLLTGPLLSLLSRRESLGSEQHKASHA